MNRTFRLGQSNEIIKDSHIYDLHNDYEATAIAFDIEKNDLHIIFRRLTADDDKVKCLELVFHDVDVLEFSGNIGANGALGLDEMGYKGVEDYDYEWLSSESQSRNSDHLVFRFDGGSTMRIHSANADIARVGKGEFVNPNIPSS